MANAGQVRCKRTRKAEGTSVWARDGNGGATGHQSEKVLGLDHVRHGNGGVTGHQSEKDLGLGQIRDGTGHAIYSFWHGICDMLSGKRGVSCPLIPENAF